MFNISAVKEFSWSSKGKNLLALHGHQFDDYTRHKDYLATIASKIYKCLRSIDVMLNRDIFHPLCYGNKSCQRLSELVNERALEYAKKHNVDYVFCGHSHRATNVVKMGFNILIPGAGMTDNVIMFR